MLDIQFIRENPEKVKKDLSRRLFKEVTLIDKALKFDEERRKLLIEIEGLRAQRNQAAKTKDIEKGKKIKKELSEKEPKLKVVEDKLKETLYSIPNIPLEDVPEGPEENKKFVRKNGKPKKFDFTPKEHLDLGVKLGIIDIQRASKVSGSRFAYLKGDGALLELALINFALEKLTKKGFIPVFPPMLIKKEITDGLGYWHGRINDELTANENYYLVYDPQEHEQGLYLIGTGEHSTVPMHSGEVLEEKELPKKYVAFSSCFRREAGSYGQDTKGILRVHQFDKVEMIEFIKPEDDKKEHENLLSCAEELMQELELPYQVVVLAAGDIGFPTAKTYDIETWLPGQNKYRETHSISTTTNYQARRLNIKYRDPGVPGIIGAGIIPVPSSNKYVHVLNGTAFAIGRTIIAILENYQQKDGSVLIPKVLQKWVGKEKVD